MLFDIMQTCRMFVKPMRSKSLVVIWLLVLTISAKSIFSRSLGESGKSRSVRSPPVTEDELEYLMKFGYIPESNFETGNLRTDNELNDALRTLQTFGNIPVTGKMDKATKELIRKPRCGIRDVSPPDEHRRKRHTLQGQKWDHVNLTWSLRTRHLQNLDIGWVRWELNRALNVWSKHSKLTFKELNSESADILVYFEKGQHGDRFPFDGQGKVLAHAFSPGYGIGGDVHFDEDEEWLLNGKESDIGVNLFIVAAHEFGHSLGLSHSHLQGALMFPWYQNPESDFELPSDDRNGIQILYGPKNKLWGDIPVYSTRPDLSNTIPRTEKTTTFKITTTTTTTTTTPRTTTSRTISTRRPDVSRYPSVDNLPDICQTTFDAVSVIRKETFFFKGKYMWRFGKKGLYPEYPIHINRFWYNLPIDMTHVDAVYERQDGKVVFFIDRRFYMYYGNILIQGYPKPLTELGLPDDLDHVDAAIVWGHNSKTYIFSGNKYWKLDDKTDRVEFDYPRDISMIWRGVVEHIDAAFQWHDGATYFLKNHNFWRFNDHRMRVEQEEPKSIGQFWFNCTTMSARIGNRDERIVNEPFGASSARVAADNVSCLLLLVVSLHAFSAVVRSSSRPSLL